MSALFNRYATPFVTGLFLVSLISGLALFLHVGPSGLHGMHEILSLVLILPFALHVWKNWRPFAAYFRRAPMLIGLALSAAMAVPFLMPADAEGQGGDRAAIFGLVRTVMAATPDEVAPLLHTTPDAVAAALQAAGLETGNGLTLADMASAAGKSEAEIAALLVAAAKG